MEQHDSGPPTTKQQQTHTHSAYFVFKGRSPAYFVFKGRSPAYFESSVDWGYVQYRVLRIRIISEEMPDPIADLTATEWDQVYEIVSKRLNNLPDVAGAYWWVTQSLKWDMSFTTSCRSPQRHLAVACASP